MDVKKHFDIILEKYNLKCMYRKYIWTSLLATITREGFYWALLYLSDLLQQKQEYVAQFSVFLLFIYGVSIPLIKYARIVKNEFIKEIRLANHKYFNDKIINIKKDTVLNFDLVDYFNALDHFNDYFQDYILNREIIYEIPIRSVSLVIIAMSKKFNIFLYCFTYSRNFFPSFISIHNFKSFKTCNISDFF